MEQIWSNRNRKLLGMLQSSISLDRHWNPSNKNNVFILKIGFLCIFAYLGEFSRFQSLSQKNYKK